MRGSLFAQKNNVFGAFGSIFTLPSPQFHTCLLKNFGLVVLGFHKTMVQNPVWKPPANCKKQWEMPLVFSKVTVLFVRWELKPFFASNSACKHALATTKLSTVLQTISIYLPDVLFSSRNFAYLLLRVIARPWVCSSLCVCASFQFRQILIVGVCCCSGWLRRKRRRASPRSSTSLASGSSRRALCLPWSTSAHLLRRTTRTPRPATSKCKYFSGDFKRTDSSLTWRPMVDKNGLSQPRHNWLEPQENSTKTILPVMSQINQILHPFFNPKSVRSSRVYKIDVRLPVVAQPDKPPDKWLENRTTPKPECCSWTTTEPQIYSCQCMKGNAFLCGEKCNFSKVNFSFVASDILS